MLSFRLDKIKKLVDPQTKVLWDLCCDHGKLGASFIGSIDEVFLVDQVDGIMTSLEKKLNRFYQGESFQCLTRDASKIDIKNIKEETIVIAGVGGHTCLNIINGLLESHNGKLECEFIISPQKNTFEVVHSLINSDFSVISHDIIFDREQKYDILKIKQEGAYAIN